MARLSRQSLLVRRGIDDHDVAMQSMPVLFIAHGSPFQLVDKPWLAKLDAWGQTLPQPQSILVLSAHWEAAPTTIGTTQARSLIYDFHGFPPAFYQTQYPAPGAPALATRVRSLLSAAHVPVAEAPQRGLDHGVYVPLLGMYPKATIPVLQLSLPSLDPAEIYRLGQALAPLRNEGVLIIGSGFLSHNLRLLREFPTGEHVPPWASEFDQWCAQHLAMGNVAALLDYRSQAPHVALALPSHEHFVPVLAALGAATATERTSPLDVSFPITGFGPGAMTLRSVQFG
jgi:4,5-DOPA dioxygenase extradiol